MDDNNHPPTVQPFSEEMSEPATPGPLFPDTVNQPESMPTENNGEVMPTDVAQQVVELAKRINRPNLQEKKADMLLAGLEYNPETETLSHTMADLGRGKLIFEARYDKDAGKTILKKSVLSASGSGLVAEVVTSDEDGTSIGKVSQLSMNPDGTITPTTEQEWHNLDHLDLTIDQVIGNIERMIRHFESGGTSAMYLMSRVLDSK